MKKFVVLGGNKEKTFSDIGQRHGVNIFFFRSFKKSSIRNQLVSIIRSADSVVIIGGCCSHKDMFEAKRIAKLYKKPFCVVRGQGATNAIRKGILNLKKGR